MSKDNKTSPTDITQQWNVNRIRFEREIKKSRARWLANRITFIKEKADRCRTSQLKKNQRTEKIIQNKQRYLSERQDCSFFKQKEQLEQQNKIAQHKIQVKKQKFHRRSLIVRRSQEIYSKCKEQREEKINRHQQIDLMNHQFTQKARLKAAVIRQQECRNTYKRGLRFSALRKAAAQNHFRNTAREQDSYQSYEKNVYRLQELLAKNLNRLQDCDCVDCRRVVVETSRQLLNE